MLDGKKMYKVMSPVEKKDGGTFWLRIGSAWPGKDPETINVRLDAMPLNKDHMMHIRALDAEELARMEEGKRRRAGGTGGPAISSNEDVPF